MRKIPSSLDFCVALFMIHALFENLPSFFMMALFGYQAIMLRNDAVLDNDHFQHSMEEGSDVEDVAEVTIVSTTINPAPKLSLTDYWRFFLAGFVLATYRQRCILMPLWSAKGIQRYVSVLGFSILIASLKAWYFMS